jgi:chromosome segregation ATPase
LRVDKDVLDKITIENKLLLFDAENELNIAIDSRDQVVDEIEQIKEDTRRAGTKRDVALRDEDAFSDKGDSERARIAGLKAVSQDARIDYLEARLDWARARLDQERAKLIVAKAKFELAKAKLVKKNNVPGASDLEIEDFEEQVKDYEEDVTDYAEDIAEAETEMKNAEQTWVTASKPLQQATGGALGSRWID